MSPGASRSVRPYNLEDSTISRESVQSSNLQLAILYKDLKGSSGASRKGYRCCLPTPTYLLRYTLTYQTKALHSVLQGFPRTGFFVVSFRAHEVFSKAWWKGHSWSEMIRVHSLSTWLGTTVENHSSYGWDIFDYFWDKSKKKPPSGHILSLIEIYNLKRESLHPQKTHTCKVRTLFQSSNLRPHTEETNDSLDPNSQLLPLGFWELKSRHYYSQIVSEHNEVSQERACPKPSPGRSGWAGARSQECQPSLQLTWLLFGANVHLCWGLLRLLGPRTANPIPTLARIMWGTVGSLSYFNASYFMPDCSVLHMSKI